MKFKPLHDQILVRRLDAEDKTKGGIILPENTREKPCRGRVIAVGGGARDTNGRLRPLDVKAGDLVLFGKWTGHEIKLDDDELLIMKEKEVLGVLESPLEVVPDKVSA